MKRSCHLPDTRRYVLGDKWKKTAYLLIVTAMMTFSCTTNKIQEEDFRAPLENGKLANEAYNRSLNLVKAWVQHRNSTTGLIGSGVNDGRRGYGLWEPHNAAADNYAFMVLTSYLLDKNLYNGPMLDILNTEKELTSRVRSLPDTYRFSTNSFITEQPDLDWIIFGTSEYIKDGLVPLMEYIGDSPWLDRMMEMLNDLPEVYSVFKEGKDIGGYYSASEEVNGEMLQTLSRVYWMTGDEKYLDWAVDIGDIYMLGERDLSELEHLRLRDHGCEAIGGLSELYVTLHYARPEKKKQYTERMYKLLDKVLEVGRNEDNLFYDEVNARTGEILKTRLVDSWGYTFNAFYSVYMVDKKEEYRQAFFDGIKFLNEKYRNYPWEGKSCDGYADAIEGGLNLFNREPVPSLKEWMDSEIKVMWGIQKESGLCSGFYHDGNFARTSIMYALWKTQGVHCSPWREDLLFGAETKGDTLLVAITADKPWEGKLTFDRKRHKEILNLPIDYPRINQFPEWFVAEREKEYQLISSNAKLNGKYTGTELIEGIPVKLNGEEPLFINLTDKEDIKKWSVDRY